MRLFRLIVIPGTALFALSVFFYIVPRTSYPNVIAVLGAITLISGIMLSLIPAEADQKLSLHGYSAAIMSVSSLLLVFALAGTLSGWVSWLLSLLGLIMILLIALALTYPHKFLYFELPFIWLCNLAVLISVVKM